MPLAHQFRFLRLVPAALAVAALFALAAPVSFAWGPTGHRVVARIAEGRVSPETAKAIAAILDGETLVEASTWADDIRSDPAWSHAGPWHYINVPDGQTYLASQKHPDGDAYSKLVEFVAVLRSPSASRSEKAVALRWVVHLVADLHQPLHVGRVEDRGGNRIEALWFGAPSNLHRIWDSALLDAAKRPFDQLATRIDAQVDVEIEPGPVSKPLEWIAESMRHRAAAYAVPEPTAGGTHRYIQQNLPLVERRLKQAGIRLAMTLDEAFEKNKK